MWLFCYMPLNMFYDYDPNIQKSGRYILMVYATPTSIHSPASTHTWTAFVKNITALGLIVNMHCSIEKIKEKLS